MICPYAVDRITKTDIQYNDDGKETGSLQYNKAVFLICQEEKCGAWKNGECRYKD